ncbi:MAG: bifunctional phosphopantothenoylcysteine decarboxylase/phosphopantothenate--cysteine ligase CoaBC [Firmicutes bacterium]|nr:bifunctional phosphopantothenoylcysteine decarboxylase/phosphopantothenate--cysteine ligase CoaBC [Bacillota bacterium]
MLEGRRVGLGVSGGIAAYKALDLCSRLRQMGAEVQVVMTENATRLIAPLAFQTLSGNPVIHAMFDEPARWNVEHIAFAQWVEVMVVAPATANVIGKVAAGIADDFLTTSIMATRAKVLFAPAMNSAMYENPIVQSNIERLRSLGYEFIEPESGWLACGESGKGRLAPVEDIVDRIVRVLGAGAAAGGDAVAGGTKGATAPAGTVATGVPVVAADLRGKTVMVTAGPTREYFDPVRYISNPSSGKMGFEIAREARDRGARVILVSGPVSLEPPAGVEYIPVVTTAEMRDAVISRLESCDALIKSAAVCDYRPAVIHDKKIKKDGRGLDIHFEPNPDILFEAGQRKGRTILVGFAAETDNLVPNAVAKIRKKNLDLIVVNDVTQQGAGFGTDTNAAKIIDPEGNVHEVSLTSKREMARIIVDRVAGLLKTCGE